MKRIFVLILTAAAGFAADDHAADRQAIRAHIESIFQAFINKDAAALRATHDEHWLGFLEGSSSPIRGIKEYMEWSTPDPHGQYGMTAYKIREMDMIFAGDAAFVTFVSDVESETPAGPLHRVLRIADFYAKNDGKWIQAGSDTELHPETAALRMQTPRVLDEKQKKNLLEAREAVWRAFFSNDRAALEKLVPEETITIESGGGEFGNQKYVLEGAAQFAKSGAKLVKLEFPQTEIQTYGYTAIIYSTYRYEVEKDGQRSSHAGRVTEVFVNRNGKWVNPGWHMDSGS